MQDRKIPTVIVEDEPVAKHTFLRLLERIPSVDVVGHASSVESGYEVIAEKRPRLVFLDVVMRDGTGFDLLEKIDDFCQQTRAPRPQVVFVTAHDQFAVKGFESNALDFLIKPVEMERLLKTVERIMSPTNGTTPQRRTGPHEDSEPIFVKIDRSYYFVEPRKIISITAQGDYTEIETEEGLKGLTLKPMKEWSDLLDEKHFVRVHRSTLINIRRVEKIERDPRGGLDVYLRNLKAPLRCSRRRAHEVLERLNTV